LTFFLPDNSHPAPAEALLQILDSVLEKKSCAYVAGPLGSGRAFYEEAASGGHGHSVRAENQNRLSDVAMSLRKSLNCPVFDSGLLKISDWSGHDYGMFFLEIIRRYARECWFANGWEYSTGATKEFVYCCMIRTPCFAESGSLLTVSDGVRLISDAADFVLGLSLDDAKLRSRVEALRTVAL
jgi:hypothetical protein